MRKTDALLVTSKEVGLEINAEKTKSYHTTVLPYSVSWSSEKMFGNFPMMRIAMSSENRV
jgi:hypothetical protein